MRASITSGLTLNGSYGYTHATFKDYETINDNNEAVNYKDNYVPFTPMHTFNIGAGYLFRMTSSCWLDQIQLDANYNGAARIYWTEQNNARQPFYGTLNARVAFNKGNGQIALWGRNLLNKERSTRLEVSFGTEKQHYSPDKVKARSKPTEILWIFFAIHTANAVRMIPKVERKLQIQTA